MTTYDECILREKVGSLALKAASAVDRMAKGRAVEEMSAIMSLFSIFEEKRREWNDGGAAVVADCLSIYLTFTQAAVHSVPGSAKTLGEFFKLLEAWMTSRLETVQRSDVEAMEAFRDELLSLFDACASPAHVSPHHQAIQRRYDVV